jgi:hypothetical protein
MSMVTSLVRELPWFGAPKLNDIRQDDWANSSSVECDPPDSGTKGETVHGVCLPLPQLQRDGGWRTSRRTCKETLRRPWNAVAPAMPGRTKTCQRVSKSQEQLCIVCISTLPHGPPYPLFCTCAPGTMEKAHPCRPCRGKKAALHAKTRMVPRFIHKGQVWSRSQEEEASTCPSAGQRVCSSHQRSTSGQACDGDKSLSLKMNSSEGPWMFPPAEAGVLSHMLHSRPGAGGSIGPEQSMFPFVW